MSGGFFDYSQWKIRETWENIQSKLENAGKLIPEENRWYKKEEEQYYEDFRDDTKEEFKKAIHFLKVAEIYTQRIDWFLSGDDGEETFHKRLKEDLSKL